MKQTITFLFSVLFSLITYAQATIKLEDVLKHVGYSVTVCGKVAGGRFLEQMENSPTFLNLGAAYPNQLLTIVIWKEIRGQFETVPEDFYMNKDICITGKIILFRERPQIVLYKKEQLQIAK